MHALQSPDTVRTYLSPGDGSLSRGPVEFPGSGCKMPLVLLLPLKRTYPNGSESNICKSGKLFTNVGIYYTMTCDAQATRHLM